MWVQLVDLSMGRVRGVGGEPVGNGKDFDRWAVGQELDPTRPGVNYSAGLLVSLRSQLREVVSRANVA